MCFDLLVDAKGNSLVDLPLSQRRQRLDDFFSQLGAGKRLELSFFTTDRREAQQWMRDMGARGLDGIVAKRSDECYHSGERVGMVKIKRIRTADCVVGGFRYASKGGLVGSLLLGLYNDEGKLDHVGFTSSFSREQRETLLDVLKPVMGPPGFTGKAPGGPSRWSTERSGEWEPLQPKLVCEVSYDHFSGGRFRHGTKFLRWRPEKKPADCTFAQLAPSRRTGQDERAAS
jgi:ATP-dependent DNA ligase